MGISQDEKQRDRPGRQASEETDCRHRGYTRRVGFELPLHVAPQQQRDQDIRPKSELYQKYGDRKPHEPIGRRVGKVENERTEVSRNDQQEPQFCAAREFEKGVGKIEVPPFGERGGAPPHDAQTQAEKEQHGGKRRPRNQPGKQRVAVELPLDQRRFVQVLTPFIHSIAVRQLSRLTDRVACRNKRSGACPSQMQSIL